MYNYDRIIPEYSDGPLRKLELKTKANPDPMAFLQCRVLSLRIDIDTPMVPLFGLPSPRIFKSPL